MRRALLAYKITGIKTTIKFLERIMENEDFRSGKYNTHFIEDHKKELLETERCDLQCEDVAIITAFIDYLTKLRKVSLNPPAAPTRSNWKMAGRRKGVQRF
jgi:acetyl-CoA carboxylase biotin carboxylase subunit